MSDKPKTYQEFEDEFSEFELDPEELSHNSWGLLSWNAAIESMQEELESLKESKEDRQIERGYLIESNSFEERMSEASHYTWIEDENERLQSELDKRDAAIKEIAPWLAASLDGKECAEYRDACNEIFKLDNVRRKLNQGSKDE